MAGRPADTTVVESEFSKRHTPPALVVWLHGSGQAEAVFYARDVAKGRAGEWSVVPEAYGIVEDFTRASGVACPDLRVSSDQDWLRVLLLVDDVDSDELPRGIALQFRPTEGESQSIPIVFVEGAE